MELKRVAILALKGGKIDCIYSLLYWMFFVELRTDSCVCVCIDLSCLCYPLRVTLGHS